MLNLSGGQPSVRAFDYITGVTRPKLRGVIHAALAVMSSIAATVLSAAASGLAMLASVIFGVSMLLCFGVSAIYHIIAKTERSQRILRRIDHAFINLLISATATPFYLLGAAGRWSTVLLCVTWAGALLGIVLKLCQRCWRSATALYLLTGWIAVAALPAMWSIAGPVPTSLIVAGGLVYTIGAICFFLKRPRLNPQTFGYHEFWHLCTAIGGTLHFIAVAMLVLSY